LGDLIYGGEHDGGVGDLICWQVHGDGDWIYGVYDRWGL